MEERDLRRIALGRSAPFALSLNRWAFWRYLWSSAWEKALSEVEARTRRQHSPATEAAEQLALLGRIQGGDERAFEELYRHFHARLARFLINLTRRPQLVEEVLNDTMIAVWERPGSFRGASDRSCRHRR